MNSPSAVQHPPSHLQHHPYADEISLFDLWDILVRRRWWVLGVWALTLLVAASYLVVTQPVFESRTVIRIGRVADGLVTPEPMQQSDGGRRVARGGALPLTLELKERYQVGEPGRELPYLKSVKQEGDDVLVLVAEAHTAAEAQQFLQSSIQELLAEQQDRYESGRELQETSLAGIEAQIQTVEQQIARLDEMVNSANVDNAVKAFAILQRGSLQTELPALHEQRLRLQYDLSELKTYPTRVVREPTLATTASAPRKGLILALALALGGMLGCMAAFFSEFVKQARNRGRQLV